jgi:thioredoxin-like negative regulator of GroEL
MFSGWVKRQIERDPDSAVMYYKNASRRAQRKDGAAAPRTLNLRKEYAVALHQVGRNEEAEAELTAVIAERGPMSRFQPG